MRITPSISVLSGILPLFVFGHVYNPRFEDQNAIVQAEDAVEKSHNLSSIIDSSPLLSFHRAICEVESISNDELAVAKYLVSYLEKHNFSVTVQEVDQPPDSEIRKKRWNVFAVPQQSTADGEISTSITPNPRVLLTSHIDTVPPFIPYSLSYPHHHHSTDAKFNKSAILISGRGTVDAKACVASQTYAVLHLISKNLINASDVGLLFVVGEENSGSGMQTFSSSSLNQKLNYTTVIFGEPTESKLATGHKGILMLTLTATGHAAHSGYPWLGLSASSAILPALTILDRLGRIPESSGGLPRSRKFGESTVNIGLIQAGVAANVIPERAMAKIAFRLAGGSRNTTVSAVERAIKNPQIDPHAALTLSFSQGYGPVDLDGNVPGFDEITVNYGTDVPNLETRKGVKRYLYGPGSILVAHGKDEALTVGDLENSVLGYQRLVLYALGKK